jgi:hypothetical protein
MHLLLPPSVPVSLSLPHSPSLSFSLSLSLLGGNLDSQKQRSDAAEAIPRRHVRSAAQFQTRLSLSRVPQTSGTQPHQYQRITLRCTATDQKKMLPPRHSSTTRSTATPLATQPATHNARALCANASAPLRSRKFGPTLIPSDQSGICAPAQHAQVSETLPLQSP